MGKVINEFEVGRGNLTRKFLGKLSQSFKNH
jgi:hypothetical protein